MFYVYPITNNMLDHDIEENGKQDGMDDDSLLSSQIGGWVYILKSKRDFQLYLGSTNDLKRKEFKTEK